MSSGLPDYLIPGLDLLLVGINPGLRSAEVGHHFAGRGNRFWDLLSDSGLTPRRLTPLEDASLLDFGLGLTNIAARPTRSSSDLGKRDFARGRRVLRDKIARYRPRAVAFVGVTAYREFLEVSTRLDCGLQDRKLEDADLFVLPNPSGRNAHFSYRDMLRHYRALARFIQETRSQ